MIFFLIKVRYEQNSLIQKVSEIMSGTPDYQLLIMYAILLWVWFLLVYQSTKEKFE